MPAVTDVNALSDEDLSQILKNYGVDVGPINVATRKTYQRKLMALQFGKASLPSSRYESANDNEDEEVSFKQSQFGSMSSPILSEPPQSRLRQVREPGHTSYLDSRSYLPSDRKTISSYSSPLAQPPSRQAPQTESKGIPVWLILVAVGISVVLLYLIYINMEPQAVSTIPGDRDREDA